MYSLGSNTVLSCWAIPQEKMMRKRQGLSSLQNFCTVHGQQLNQQGVRLEICLLSANSHDQAEFIHNSHTTQSICIITALLSSSQEEIFRKESGSTIKAVG